MTSSWFFLSTLNYDARSTTHQISVLVKESFTVRSVVPKYHGSNTDKVTKHWDFHIFIYMLLIRPSIEPRRINSARFIKSFVRKPWIYTTTISVIVRDRLVGNRLGSSPVGCLILLAIHVQAWTDPEKSRRWRLQEFLHSRHMKVASMSALHTGCL